MSLSSTTSTSPVSERLAPVELVREKNERNPARAGFRRGGVKEVSDVLRMPAVVTLTIIAIAVVGKSGRAAAAFKAPRIQEKIMERLDSLELAVCCNIGKWSRCGTWGSKCPRPAASSKSNIVDDNCDNIHPVLSVAVWGRR